MREARAFAAASQGADCRAALSSAEQALDQVSIGAGAEPPWVYWLDQAVLTNETGRCLLRLGETRQAIEHLNRGIGMIGDGPSRDRILYGLFLAHALISAAESGKPEIELACNEARQVLPMMQMISSQRCQRQLDLVIASVRGYRTASVRALLEEVEEAGPPCL